MWFLSLLNSYRRECFLIVAGILLQVALYVVYPLAFQKIFDRVIPYRDTGLLVTVMTQLTGLFVICSLGAVMQSRLVSRVGSQVLRDLRLRMFERLNRLSSSFFMNVNSSDLLSRFSYEFAAIELALIRALPALIECILVVLACMMTIATIDWRISLVAAILMPMSFISGKLLGPKVDELVYRRIGLESGLLGVLQESLHARPIIRAFGIEEERQRKFAAYNNDLARTSVEFCFFSALIPLSSLYGVNILLVAIVGTGAAFVNSGGLSIGAFFGCFALLMSVAAGSSSAAAWYAAFMAASTKVTRINELLAARVDVADANDATQLSPFSSEIRFNNVVFGYLPEYPILRGVSCSIKAGSSVALVGGSGSGKSTMLNLIMRFYDPTEGSLTIDGTDIRRATQASIRRQIGVVMQEAYLFNTSVAENIRHGKLDATQEEIEEAARTAEIHDFICQLPDGYNTYIGENGGFLSGGQRQRIAIARAILRKPAMLLLDEPTSALDPSTEASINRSIEQLAGGRTVIMVTHRLTSVQRFNRIFVLSEGRVAEQGNHYELLEKDGVYRELWDKQSGVSISADGTARVTPERLKAIPIFAQVGLDVLARVAAQFISEYFGAGSVVIRQGELSDKFYVIVRGSLEVLKADAEGVDKRIAILQDGDHFGEIAPLKVVPRNATLRAQSPTLCLSLNRESFVALVESQPQLRAELEKYIQVRSESKTA